MTGRARAGGRAAGRQPRGPRMLRIIAALALGLAALPAVADEFTDAVDSALEAYRDKDVKGAREELDYAVKLLDGMKSESLGKLLPEPLPGWTKEASDASEAEGAGMAMAMFGGGTAASAKYSNGSADISITLIADSPMVTGIGGMLAGLAGAGAKPIRINRTQFSVNDGELQGVVNSKVMVNVSGSASLEQKQAQLEAMDFKALGDF
jgi:hypothetical protein